MAEQCSKNIMHYCHEEHVHVPGSTAISVLPPPPNCAPAGVEAYKLTVSHTE